MTIVDQSSRTVNFIFAKSLTEGGLSATAANTFYSNSNTYSY